MSYKFVCMNRPLDYAVYQGKKMVIPAGATGVRIAFRQSPFKRPSKYGDEQMNVYLYRGHVWHA